MKITLLSIKNFRPRRSSIGIALLIIGNLLYAQTITVTDAGDSGVGTLRQAILDANSTSGGQDIVFDAGLAGSTISVQSVMSITGVNADFTTIDGDIDGDGDPDITLSGGSYSGIEITASGCTVNGLHFIGFINSPNAAININGGSVNTITGNYIGTNLSGTAIGTANFRGVALINGATGNLIGDGTSAGINVLSNNSFGVYINGSNGNTVSGNLIGLDVTGATDLGNSGSGLEIIGATGIVIGVNGEQLNIISGNGSEGISLTSSSSATIVNNYIGTDITGNLDRGNDNEGILLDATSTASIGDGTVGGLNVISGNGQTGLQIASDNNNILGNYIGIGANGTTDIGNSADGIWIQVGATGNTIGDGSLGGRNIISGNSQDGVRASAGPTFIYGNYIGTNANGDAAVGNDRYGVFIASGGSSEIGDAIGGYGNLISGNGFGIRIIVSSNSILGNYIGTNAAGTSGIPNINEGILLIGSATNNVIGDGSSLGSNLIASNGTDGILLNGSLVSANTISRNSIFNNTGSGIRVINSAQNGVVVPTISSTLNGLIVGTSDPSATIEIFADVADEGEQFLEMTTADGFGDWSRQITVAAINSGLTNISVNQTSSSNTSELASAPLSLPFISTWTTNDGQITIPTFSGETYNYDISWTNLDNVGIGDGSASVSVDTPYNITGLQNGDTYQVEITGAFPRIYFAGGGDAQKILTIQQWGDISWSSMANAFQGCSNLTVPASDAPVLSSVTDLTSMFQSCTGLTTEDFNNWDVSNVQDMTQVFAFSQNFNGSVDMWDVSTATTMFGMFWDARSFNQDLDGWIPTAVTDISQMFQTALSFNGNIDGWNMPNLTTAVHTFYQANAFNQSLNNWTFGVLDNMSGMFREATAFNGNIASWNVSTVTDMSNVFLVASSFNQDISGWETGNVITLSGTFYLAASFNQDLTYIPSGGNMGGDAWDVSNVANMTWTFRQAAVFNGDVTNWNVSGATTMYGMFESAAAFNQPIDSWGANTGGVTDMTNMFLLTNSFNQDLDSWDVSNVTSMSGMFLGASAFNGNISSWNTGNVTLMNEMFDGATVFNQDIGGWDMTKVTTTYRMFETAFAFNQDLTFQVGGGNGGGDAWNVSSVVNMDLMFSSATSFNGDVTNWDVSNGPTMFGAFAGATAFDQNIGGWIMTNVSNTNSMFTGATSFNQDISGWNVTNITDMGNMFLNASSFNQDIGGWITSSLVTIIQMFDGATSFNQDISGWDVSGVADFRWVFLNATAFDQNLGSWDLSSATTLHQMLNGSGLSTANYDATLIGWEAQGPPSGIPLGASGVTYCISEVERQNLIDTYGWSIGDAGVDCSEAFTVTNTEDSGIGSLRWTIDNANIVSGTDNITFNISTGDPNHNSGVWTISPTTDLPDITETIILDAATQPGTENFKIVLDGAGTLAEGLHFTNANAAGSEVLGLYITNFSRGIRVQYLSTSGLTIGSPTGRNTIVNCTVGIEILNVQNMLIQSNYIGTDELGSAVLGNTDGIQFTASPNHTIGGSGVNEGNVISNNTNGIRANASAGQQILGNLIGTTPNGLAPLGNSVSGIFLSTGSGHTITGNVISGNDTRGLFISNSDNNIIQDNFFGVGVDGTTSIPNGIGIETQSGSTNTGNQIGGLGVNESNIIANNITWGVALRATNDFGNEIIGNEMYCNGTLGIYLQNGANNNMLPPVINGVTASTVGGTGLTGEEVHLYRDNSECVPGQGAEYLGTAVVDGAGDWLVTGLTLDPGNDGFTATATNATDGTSEFSFEFMDPPGHALDLDGTNDQVTIGNPAELQITGDLTIEAWFKVDGPQNLFSTLVGKWSTGGSNASYTLGIYGGFLTFGLTSAGGDNQGIGSGSDHDDGLWHHAAGVWDGTTMRLYVDGCEVNSSTPAGFGTISNTSLDFIIGADASGQADRFFDGQIDEVRIWSEARSESDLRNNIFSVLAGNETNLQAYYRFDESGATVILPDVTSNLNDGTFTGGSPQWVASGAFTEFIPKAATDLFTTEISASQIDLSWTDNAFNETGYTIERSDGNNSGFVFHDVVGVDANFYSDSPLTAENGYYYRVIANGVSGDSNPSNEKFGSTISPSGNALAFDGVADFVDLGDPPEVDFGAGDFTFELWFKPNSLADGARDFLTKGGGGTQQFALQFDRNSTGNVKNLTVFFVRSNATFSGLDSDANVITDMNWHHVVGLRRGNNLEIYLDGVLIKSGVSFGTAGGAMAATSENLNIGGIASSVNGEIDEVRIWSEARTQVEIQNNMFTTLLGNEPNLVAYYRFDQGIGNGDNTTPAINLLPDRSQNQIDGTLNGFVLNGTTSNWVNSDAFNPVDPTNLVTTEVSATQIDLSWTDNALNETGYTIERSDGNNSNFVVHDTAPADATSYSDTVTPESGYFYRVIANGASGDSNPSNEKFGSTITPPGNALAFDGVDDFVSVPHNPAFGGAPADDFTWSVWVKVPTDISGGNGTGRFIIGKSTPFVPTSAFDRTTISINKSTGIISAGIQESEFNNQSVVSTTDLRDNKWHHISFVRDRTADQVILYIDGQEEDNITDIDNDGSNTEDLWIGDWGRLPQDGRLFKGEIDEVSIWSTARSQSEIREDMFTTLIGNEMNLEAYYRFDQGVAGIINTGINYLPDRSQNQNDGTLTNFDVGAADVTNSNWLISNAQKPILLAATNVSKTGFTANWQAVAGATDILVQVDDDPNFGSPLIDDLSVATGGTAPITQSLGPGLYYYRIKADIGSSITNYSLYSSFILPPGNALDFVGGGGGVGDVVVIPDNPSFDLDFGDDDFTAEMWISTTAGGGTLMGKHQCGFPNGWFVAMTGANFTFFVGNTYLNSVSTINDGNWHHIAVTFDATTNTQSIYVDGVLDGSQTTANGIDSNVATGIGGWTNASCGGVGNGSIPSEIDEVRIWNTVRTLTEIQDNRYNELVGNEPGLAAYYNFNHGIAEGDNTSPPVNILIDVTANGNDGTLTNMSLIGSTSNWVGSGAFNPLAPTELITTEISADQIDLNWTDNALNETGYTIERSDGNNSSFVFHDVVGVDANSYSDSPLTAENGYYYRVIANGVSGDSNPSNEKFGSTITPPGNALDFDGVDNYVNLNNAPELEILGDLTLSAWVFWNGNTTSTSQTIVSRSVDGDLEAENINYWFHIEPNGQLRFFHENGAGSDVAVLSSSSITANEWVHVAVTRAVAASSDVTFYINGTLDNQVTGLTNPSGGTDAGQEIWLGAKNQLMPTYFDGRLDEVRIWNNVRTQLDIQNDMFSTVVGNELNLAASYRFDQGIAEGDNTTPAVNILPDRSQNQNDGTLNGFALNGSNSNWVTGLALNQPTNLLADGTYGLTSPEVVLTWDDNTDLESDYEIDRAEDTSFTTNLQTFNLGGSNTGSATYTDNTVSDGTLYFYRVRAISGSINSSNSNAITAVPVVEAGNAASFGSSTEYVGVTPTIGKNTDWTFTCWFKGNGRIYSEGGGTSGVALFTIDTYPTWSFVLTQVYNSSNAPVWADARTLGVKNQNDWNFFAISVSGATDAGSITTVILNNSVKTESLPVLKHPSTILRAVFGRNVGSAYGGQPDSDFAGEIDEAATWSRALTEAEMFALRDTGISPFDPDLLSLWHFDEPGSSLTVYDASGNDNHGTRTNNPLQIVSEALFPFDPNLQVFPQNGQAELIWDQAVESDFKQYNISYKLNSDGTYTDLPAHTIVTDTSITISGLTNSSLYDFKVTTTDLVDQEGPGSVISAVPEVGAGNAVLFDGVNSEISVPDNGIFNRGSGLTLEGWIRPDNLDNTFQFLAGVSDAFGIRISDTNRLDAFTNDGGGGIITTDVTTQLIQDEWSHVAMAFDGASTVRLFVNGIQIHEDASMTIPQNSTQSFWMGRNNAGTIFFDGAMDEVRLWDHALDETSIQANMFAPLRGDETNVGPNNANLIGLWHFDEPAGHGTAYSAPSNKNNATLGGNADYILSGAMLPGGVIQQDYDALIALYNSTDGANWTNNTNWLSANPVSTWAGVFVVGDRVRNVILPGNNLNGIIPPEIGDLTDIDVLDLSGNIIGGSIPAELTNLTNLIQLILKNNQLTGSIPTGLDNLNFLQWLDLENNQLSGLIPTDLGNLNQLTILVLGSNQLTGSIPPELGSMSSLNILALYNNQLDGNIPTTLGDLTNLTRLDVANNQLSGSIPDELASLSSLEALSFYQNNLTGSIPPLLGNLSALTLLSFGENLMDGNIPAELGDLTQLNLLDFSGNAFDGIIPTELGNLSLINELYFYDNQLTGTIPDQIGNLSSLTATDFGLNGLSGAVPMSFTNLTNLTYLGIEGNQLIDLPDLSALPVLTDLEVLSNSFEFDDLEPNIGIPTFLYSPQANLLAPGDITLNEGEDLNVTISVGGSANEYQWIKDGGDITGQISDNLFVNSVTATDAGIYSLRTTNTLVPGLTLMSESFQVTVGVAAEPEIALFRGADNTGIEIFNNSIEPIDLGTTTVGSDFEAFFTIENQGTSALTISSITSNSSEFGFSGSPTSVDPGTIDNFFIILNGTTPGIHTASIVINNNDSDENPFSFNVTGSVVESLNLVFYENGTSLLSGSSIDFGQTKVDEPLSRTFTLENPSSAQTLAISSLSVDDSEFSVVGAPGSIAPSETTDFEVVLAASAKGVFNGNLTIESNFEPFTIQISGEVIPRNKSVHVFNAVTPNGDGVHDFMRIQRINEHPNNKVFIFNRNGKLLYEASGYNNEDIRFEGKGSDGKTLLAGTYYYVIELSGSEREAGFIQIITN